MIAPKIVTIIPARGGSKRVPRKNLAPIAGKPLVAWSIEASLRARLVDRTLVSTDDPEIAAVAAKYGAEVVERPAELSGDTASSELALLHALDWLSGRYGADPDLMVFLQATSPLRRPNDIDGAIEALRANDGDSLLSVSPTPGFLWQVENGIPTPMTFTLDNRPRSQELQNRYVIENGSIYVFRTSLLRAGKNRLGGKIVPYFQPAICAVDMDHPEDVAITDILMRSRALDSAV